MSDLPVNIDVTYADDPLRPGTRLHQQYHDALHVLHNRLKTFDPATSGGAHPDLVAHDALGLATQGELNAVAAAKADTAHTHPIERTTVTTAAYTAALGDANKVVRMTFAGASTLTIPANATVAFPLDTIINPYAAGGALTIAAAAGVTIDNNAAAVAHGVEVSLRYDGADKWVRAG